MITEEQWNILRQMTADEWNEIEGAASSGTIGDRIALTQVRRLFTCDCQPRPCPNPLSEPCVYPPMHHETQCPIFLGPRLAAARLITARSTMASPSDAEAPTPLTT